jgi:membrane-associated phospholipid phosphatase
MDAASHPETHHPETDGRGRATRRDVLVVIVLAAVLAGLFMLYGPLNHGPQRWVLKTPLDERIPLVKPLVVPYLSIFVVGAGTFVAFLWPSREAGRGRPVGGSLRMVQSLLLASVLTLIVACLLYAFAQTYVARPVVTGDDVFSRLLRSVYGNDNAYNCFPSLHTAFSVVMGVHWMWFNPRVGRWVAAWCGLIVVSTVFVHQHYVADVAGGIVVAGVACLAARSLITRLTGHDIG